MPILDKNDEVAVKKLKDFFENSEYASYYQSFEWAEIKKNHWKSEYVYVEENGKILGAMLILIRTMGKFFTMMYAARGPIADLEDTKLILDLVEEAKPLAKKYKAFVLKMAPEIPYSEEIESNLRNSGLKVKSEFKNILAPMQTGKNMILHIDGKTEEEIMSGYSSKTRYNIRLASKKGVTVRYSSNEEDIKTFYELMKVTGERDKIAVRDYDYYKKIVDIYKDKARIYIAEHEGEPLAAALAINYGRKVTYFYGASSNNKRNLMPTYLMQQTMIEWAIETNCKDYDFGGVFNTTKDNGLYRFKEGFCRQEGTTKFIGEIDKVYKRFSYYIFSKVVPMVKKLMLDIDEMRKKKNK